MNRPTDCTHEIQAPGPRMPLDTDSASTIVCLTCGMWRDARPLSPSRWRPANQLLILIATK